MTQLCQQVVLRIEIKNKETGAYEALDLAKTYYLTTNDFLAAGGDGYTMLGGAREEGPSMDIILCRYLKVSKDLTAYAAINPNSRTISMSANKDTDGWLHRYRNPAGVLIQRCCI